MQGQQQKCAPELVVVLMDGLVGSAVDARLIFDPFSFPRHTLYLCEIVNAPISTSLIQYNGTNIDCLMVTFLNEHCYSLFCFVFILRALGDDYK